MATDNRLSKRWDQWRRERADERLFRHLAEVHRLEASDMDLLAALADHHRLVRLSEIFVRPSLWKDPPDSHRWSEAQLRRIRGRIGGAKGTSGNPRSPKTGDEDPSS